MQEQDVVGKYVSSELVGGKKTKETIWHLAVDHKAIQDGVVMGLWDIDDGKVIITYHTSLFGTAILENLNNNLVGVNNHTNGAVFNWVMEKLGRRNLNNPEGWTFAIPTGGSSKFHNAAIESIRDQKIPNYEIIFCTENENFKIDEPDVKVIYIGKQKPNWISKKKNEMTKAAKYRTICYMHDYVMLHSDWYEGFQKFGYDWDICQNRLIHPDGGRLRDWMSLDAPGWGHVPIPYTVSNITDKMYVSGTYWCAWKCFMLRWPLNEALGHRENEDGEWSCRIRKFWDLKFNPYSTAKCLRFSNV